MALAVPQAVGGLFAAAANQGLQQLIFNELDKINYLANQQREAYQNWLNDRLAGALEAPNQLINFLTPQSGSKRRRPQGYDPDDYPAGDLQQVSPGISQLFRSRTRTETKRRRTSPGLVYDSEISKWRSQGSRTNAAARREFGRAAFRKSRYALLPVRPSRGWRKRRFMSSAR